MAEAALLGVAPGVSARVRVVRTVTGTALSVTVVVSDAALPASGSGARDGL